MKKCSLKIVYRWFSVKSTIFYINPLILRYHFVLLILRFHCWFYDLTVDFTILLLKSTISNGKINSETLKSTNVRSKINLCTKSLIVRKKILSVVSRFTWEKIYLLSSPKKLMLAGWILCKISLLHFYMHQNCLKNQRVWN
jgi:hypothetical protein